MSGKMSRKDIIMNQIEVQYKTIANFSRETGIPDGSIRNIKNRADDSIDNMDVRLFLRICQALHLDAEELLSGRLCIRPNSQKVAVINEYRQNTDRPETIKKAPSLSDEAKAMGQRWANLDRHGQTVVSVVVTEEEKRMEQEKKARRSQKVQGAGDPEAPARVIPLFYNPPAAGYASPAFGEDFEYIEVGGDVPPHAEYAVRIDGDSMEPYIPDRSVVYVNHDPLANGDVGIFFLDGDMLCKQYHRDEWGNVNLLSLNRARADADRFIPEESGLTFTCHGRVILPHPLRLAVPENELL